MARVVAGALVGLVAGALVFIGRPEGWIAGAAVLALILLTRVAQVAVRGRQWGELVPHPAGDSLRAGLTALIVVVAIVALSRLTAFLPDHKAAAPLTGTTLLVPTSGDAWTDRAASWPGTLRLAARHPLGAGPDCFRHAFLEVAWAGGGTSPFNLAHQAIHPGNSFLEMLAETGVLGGLALLALVAVLLAQAGIAAATAPPPWSAVGFASLNVMLAMIATGLLGAPFQQAAPSLLFWTTAGMVQIAALASPVADGIRARLLPLSVTRPRAPLRRRTPIVAALVLGIGAMAAGALLIDRARGSRFVLAGQAAFYAGNYEQALLALRQPAVRRLPDHLPHVLAGNACWRLGMLDHAVEQFTGALDRSPHFPGALLARAAVRQTQGRYDLAESDLKAALAIWPRSTDTLLAYA
ncbi:MAG TPA: hypothetical protein VFX28_24110, partial [Methylomirabilota bacterium]|nr:hypothetical protein [Methylomirabilota bacterium]